MIDAVILRAPILTLSVAVSVLTADFVHSSSVGESWSHSSWAGGIGAEGTEFRFHSTAEAQFASSDQLVNGRLSMRLHRPRGAAETATFTAQLQLHDGYRIQTYRGRGAIASTGKLVNPTWKSSGSDAPELTVALERPGEDPDAQRLAGRVVVTLPDGATREWPVFILPNIFDARRNPLAADSATGKFTTFFRDPLHVPGAGLGTGVGAASISKAGKVRLKAVLGDTSRLTARAGVVVWPDGGHLFLVAPQLSGRRFFGAAYLLDPDDAESDWRAWANILDPGDAETGSLAPLQDALLVAYAPPVSLLRPLPWQVGIMEFDLPQADGPDSPPSAGLIGWRGAKRLSAAEQPIVGESLRYSPRGSLPGVFQARLLRMTFAPRDGLLRGRMSYFFLNTPSAPAKQHKTNFSAAVNQKTGEIEGFIAPREAGKKSGILSVYADATPPAIELLGDNPLEVIQGGAFVDPGARVNDEFVDQPRTITGTGPVDTATPGTYSVTYSASDFSGNQAEDKVRTVVVRPVSPAE